MYIYIYIYKKNIKTYSAAIAASHTRVLDMHTFGEMKVIHNLMPGGQMLQPSNLSVATVGVSLWLALAFGRRWHKNVCPPRKSRQVWHYPVCFGA